MQPLRGHYVTKELVAASNVLGLSREGLVVYHEVLFSSLVDLVSELHFGVDTFDILNHAVDDGTVLATEINVFVF